MSVCKLCGGQGLVFLKYQTERGYDVAACTCGHGQRYRVPWQLRAWVAQQDPGPEYFGRLEDFYTPAELATLVTVNGETLSEFARMTAASRTGQNEEVKK